MKKNHKDTLEEVMAEKIRGVKLETIHESLVNGQRKQMVEQIEKYGLYDFWSDYKCFLAETYATVEAAHSYFTDAVISYFRIKEI